jgi:hypothetical protein
MITLVRGREIVALKPELWETLQDLARQEGWRPVGAVAPGTACARSTYGPGRTVIAHDARGLAKALKQVVNSPTFDGLEIDLAPLVQLINFVSGGAFDIRK